MTRQLEIPEVNYILFSGTVIEKGGLESSRFQMYVIRFRVENTISHDGVEGRRSSHNLAVEAWGDLAEEVERNVSTGTAVLVEGSLVSRTRIRNDAEYHTMLVKASSVTLLNART